MAAVTGKGGTITYDGGPVKTISNWTIDVDNSLHDITSFTTSVAQWREWIAGLSGWTGAMSGTFDPASTGQNDAFTDALSPASKSAVFELDQAGGKLSGNVYISALSVGTDIDAPVDVAWTFQGTGALAYSTTT